MLPLALQILRDMPPRFLPINRLIHTRSWLFLRLEWLVDIAMREFVVHQGLVDNLLIGNADCQLLVLFVQIAPDFLPIVRWRFQPPFFALPNARSVH